MTAEPANTPPMPAGISERAQGFWRDVVEAFDLTDAETQLLIEAVRMMSEIDALRDALDAQGITVVGSTGQPRVHPAVAEIRQHRMALGRLLRQIDLADDQPETEATKAARAAAQARWTASRVRDAAAQNWRDRGTA